MMEKGKELKSPEGRGGGKGSGIREADSDDPGSPYSSSFENFFTRSYNLPSCPHLLLDRLA